jgi:hypothetical protein
MDTVITFNTKTGKYVAFEGKRFIGAYVNQTRRAGSIPALLTNTTNNHAKETRKILSLYP